VGVRRPGRLVSWGGGQFFDTNPGDRSPQGPKRGGWSRGVPRTWRTALDLPAVDARDAAAEEAPADGSSGDTAPPLGVPGDEEPRI
jgi:hypothetical protein